jgi:D-galactarolactone isomerase
MKGACDSHIHIYDRAFLANANAQGFVEHADVAAYREVQKRIGTERVVIVTPRVYGTDNAVTVDAIRQLGISHARGIAVLNPSVTDDELHALNEGGIRGIRFTLYTAKNAAVGFEMIEPLAQRVAELGWHVQLHFTAEQIVEHAEMLRRLPSAMVFDHRARLVSQQHEAFGIVRELADEGRAWIKLSGPYLDSQAGIEQRYADVAPIARAWIDAVPGRLVWGGDWPHVTETHKPDDAMLFDLLSEWTDNDDALRERILVTSPAMLYGFAR